LAQAQDVLTLPGDDGGLHCDLHGVFMTIIANANGGLLESVEMELLPPMGAEPACVAVYLSQPNPPASHLLWNSRPDGSRYAVDQQLATLSDLVNDCLLLSGADSAALNELATAFERCAARIRLASKGP
jgi:hypothetical protein